MILSLGDWAGLSTDMGFADAEGVKALGQLVGRDYPRYPAFRASSALCS
jgi:hypothetical protein